MASGHYGVIVRHLRRLFQEGTVTGLSEGQLLDRFVARRDEAAFEALVARHGPMVLAVCRQILRDSNDVDDAFQATFLILMRKAGSLRQQHLLGNWLYGVAYRVATRARAQAAHRCGRERPGAEEAAVAPAGDATDSDELRPLLHEELNRLPEKYRAPVVLCYFEGQTHEEAAEQLRWPVGTVKGRLARARDLLRSRLVRRGLALSAAAWTTELARAAQAAAVPHLLAESTVEAAIHLAAGRTAVAGAVSASVVSLTEGVLKAMLIAKWKMVGAVAVAAGVVAGSAGLLAQQIDAKRADESAPAGPSPDTAAGGESDQPAGGAIAAARTAYQQALTEYRHGKVGSETVYQWSRRILDRQQAQDPSQQVAALGAHRDRMNTLRHWADFRRAEKEANLDVSAAEYYRQEAEQWLADARKGSARVAQGMGASMGSGMAPAGGTSGPPLGASGGSGGVMNAAGSEGAMQDPVALQMSGAGSGGGAGGRPPMTGRSGGGSAGGMGAAMISSLGLAGPASLRQARQNPVNKPILDKLEKAIPMSFPDETPLEDVLGFIRASTGDEHEFPIYLDPNGLAECEKTPQSPVKLNLEGVPLKTTLRLALHQLGLVYAVRDGVLIITSPNSDLLAGEEDLPDK